MSSRLPVFDVRKALMPIRPQLKRLAYGRSVGRCLLVPMVRWGHRRYVKSGDTPRAAYAAMRKLYGNSEPTLFEDVADRIGVRPLTTSGPGGGIASAEVDEVVRALRTDGVAVLSTLLEPSVCDELEEVARRSACVVVGPDGPLAERAPFDSAAMVGLRYDLDERDIVGSPAAQSIIADPSLFQIASDYLGGEPVQDLVAMWWSASAPPSDAGSAAAAQQFHFDLDRVRFLKVFVFLTDVDERTGPHVYVVGTHRSSPARFRADGRHADAAVLPAFGDAVRTITGPRGTIFVADTRGLHKGQHLESGHRLVFQTEYATSLFGNGYTRPTIERPTDIFMDMRNRFPFAFARFQLADRATANTGQTDARPRSCADAPLCSRLRTIDGERRRRRPS